ncbi:hypothetical protein M422DRAFT_26553 [Sphaerobolus stellatus SS14]|nr:hypothetical protein M422DRAFT_26553 [Sphaerobolus stellatus SS14]
MDAIPPGLQGPSTKLLSGSHPSYDGDWRPFDGIKRYTNVFIWDKDAGKVLLGFKKRGFGVNLFNGFGGKVEPGETTLQGAMRELKEEAGIEADLTHAGTLLYYGEGIPLGQHVEVFAAHSFQGDPTESEEMRPKWFRLPEDFIQPPTTPNEELPPFPFNKMWEDAKLWIPIMLSGKRFIGRVDFVKITSTAISPEDTEMARWWFGSLD